MQRIDEKIVYSASDIVNFLECEHLTTLDLINLDTPLQKTEADDHGKLIQAKGYAHEADFEEILKHKHSSFIEIAQETSNLDQMVQKTSDAMNAGVEIICQATFRDSCFVGHADFLRRVSYKSKLGDFSYEVLDT